ncbi:hypothetical protein BD779DRAFT_1478852 [Infundibulicybe gibba]|nr:hypothetical protein BD779DRAFT_1478852 [Infundibulicybe gibba]
MYHLDNCPPDPRNISQNLAPPDPPLIQDGNLWASCGAGCFSGMLLDRLRSDPARVNRGGMECSDLSPLTNVDSLMRAVLYGPINATCSKQGHAHGPRYHKLSSTFLLGFYVTPVLKNIQLPSIWQLGDDPMKLESVHSYVLSAGVAAVVSQFTLMVITVKYFELSPSMYKNPSRKSDSFKIPQRQAELGYLDVVLIFKLFRGLIWAH